ncbi:MAG: hypothetical protein ACTHLA_08140 [Asticcacaulis sp.]|uniref:hypothetical protein n=1 Tax=Asticcacaulis sp. TaxID=1872648 RepID=UPI003F7CAFDD
MPRTRVLNSERLGRLGERQFALQCHPSFHCNKAEEDRTGWDYYVEWPNPSPDTSIIDTRPVPISCAVQVKTIWTSTHIVTAPLSSVERLAKEPKPSFFYVMQMADDGQLVAAYVIHIAGQFLERILKALRQAHVEGVDPSEKTFSFSLKKWATNLSLAREAFGDFVETVVAKGMAEYIEQKRRQLDNLGYSAERLTIKGTAHFTGKDQIIDCFIGNSDFSFEIKEALDLRFGIAASAPGLLGPGKARFMPGDDSKCQVVFSRGPLSEAFLFPAVFIALPESLNPGVREIIIDAELFQMTLAMVISNDGSPIVSINFSMKNDRVHEIHHTADEWAKLYSLLDSASTGELRLEIRREASQPIRGSVGFQASGPSHGWSGVVAIMRGLKKVLNVAGFPNTTFRIDTAMDHWQSIASLHEMLEGIDAKSTLSFSVAGIEQFTSGEPMDVIHFSTIPLDQTALVYGIKYYVAPVEEADGKTRWHSDRYELIQLTCMPVTEDGSLPSTAHDWMNRVAQEGGVNIYIVAGIPAVQDRTETV